MPRHALLATAIGVVALPALAAVGTAPAAGDPASGGRHACTRTTDQAGGTSAKHDIESGGRDRTFILHLPDHYEQHDDWPLIVAYHGRGSTGTEVEGFSRLSTLPAVVAYPNGEIGTGSGYRQAWQGAPYEPPGVDDVAFTRDLLDELQGDLCVDARRTYATGKSNGAGFVGLLACRLPDRFAAVAPVAGAFYPGTEEGCADAPPVPVLDVHGTGDTTIPYAGDADRGLPAIPDWVQGWVDRDGCRAAPQERTIGTDVTIRRWRDCGAGAEVEHVAVQGGGHVWPGADVYSGGGYVTHTIQAERVMWSFFQRHELPEEVAP